MAGDLAQLPRGTCRIDRARRRNRSEGARIGRRSAAAVGPAWPARRQLSHRRSGRMACQRVLRPDPHRARRCDGRALERARRSAGAVEDRAGSVPEIDFRMSTAPHSLAVVRQRVSSGSPLEPTIGFSRAVLTGAKSSSPPPQRFGRTVTLIRIPASRHAVVSRSSTRRFASRARHSLTSCVRAYSLSILLTVPP
jgi:hypothetical protein